jgi:hypothetical protein
MQTFAERLSARACTEMGRVSRKSRWCLLQQTVQRARGEPRVSPAVISRLNHYLTPAYASP